MPQVGLKSTNPVFERPKTVHVSDRAGTVIGPFFLNIRKFIARTKLVYFNLPISKSY
jgi:hypothetical protein